jgi:hypothetical protein
MVIPGDAVVPANRISAETPTNAPPMMQKICRRISDGTDSWVMNEAPARPAAKSGRLFVRSAAVLKMVLKHNRNDSDARKGISLSAKSREVAMKNVQTYRAMGSICRQRAVFDPQNSWKHLGDAERWEHLAEAEISEHFEACNAAGPNERADAVVTPGTDNMGWKTTAVA